MAATDFFLKIDGIDGESMDSKHKGEIQPSSWSWGESNSGSAALGGGMGAGKVNMSDFTFTLNLGKSSPALMLACASGQHIAKAVLTCRKAGGDQQEYLTITFSDLLLSNYTISASPHEVLPSESCSFNFSKIEMEYKTQDAKGGLTGSIKKGWDTKANKKI